MSQADQKAAPFGISLKSTLHPQARTGSMSSLLVVSSDLPPPLRRVRQIPRPADVLVIDVVPIAVIHIHVTRFFFLITTLSRLDDRSIFRFHDSGRRNAESKSGCPHQPNSTHSLHYLLNVSNLGVETNAMLRTNELRDQPNSLLHPPHQ